MLQTPTAMFASLVKMRDSAGKFIYKRLTVAADLLARREWVEDRTGGGGDLDKALTRLEEDCFADLCGNITLCALLDMLHNVPDIAVWKKHKFNLRRIWAEWSASRQGQRNSHSRQPARTAPRSFTSPLAFSELTTGAARKEYGRAVTKIEAQEEKIMRLEQENADLREENSALKSKIALLRQALVA